MDYGLMADEGSYGVAGWSLGRRFSVLGRLRDCETRVVETVEDLSFRRPLPLDPGQW